MSLAADTFDYVALLVRERSAIQLAPGKEYLVESRLAPLARERGHTGPAAVDDYVRAVRRSPGRDDLTRVVEAMTTNETSWFRDSTPFTALREVVLPAVRAANPGTLRVWSAACSTGQEPYSIAMTLLDAGERRFDIRATDLSTAVLEKARAGTFSQLEMNRGLPATMLVRHFARAGAGWAVSDELRRLVTFSQHNLLTPAPPGPFDVVFLRNVLIYFDPPTKREILARLSRVLRPGGFLVLGATESVLGIDERWERMVAARGPVYRAPGGAL